jgi:peptidyl-prolyl cis-trans isomerase B (cyclophilin B)
VPKNTRAKQLAKAHERRQAERRHHERRRQVTAIVVALAIAIVGGGVAVAAFSGGDDTTTSASGATKPSDQTGATGATAATGASGQASTVTPTPGPKAVACGGEEPRDATKPKPQFSKPKQVIEPGSTYTAEMQTSCGTITFELLADQAPQTVNSFVFLAERGYFDGQRFHRLDTSIDVIQGGDPTATGSGGPGYSIPDELTGKESYGPGTLAMANAGPNTGGSQFFIITGDKGHNLDANPNYTIFGTITDGLDVARKIQQLPIQDPNAAASGDLSGQQPKQSVYIEKITIHQS